MRIGDVVSNGHWRGNVLAIANDWVWVMPRVLLATPNRPEQPYPFDDGPLTFREADLKPQS